MAKGETVFSGMTGRVAIALTVQGRLTPTWAQPVSCTWTLNRTIIPSLLFLHVHTDSAGRANTMR